jgi:pyrroloquinoline-quinone synthase
MTRIEELQSIVAQYDLNSHPFYQDWRAGKLPMAKLVDYSGEYGLFVSTIAAGWDTIGEPVYANEEREHEVMWDDFRGALGFETLSLRVQTDTLVTAARNLFSKKSEAVGALFAFESQQPYTAQSKLDGLNEHYPLSEEGKRYFVVHASDFAEVEDLKKYIANLTDEEFARTKTACGILSAAMWGALDGIYYV